MSPEHGYRLAAVVVLLLLSAFIAGSETALFSLSRVARERMRRSGRRADRLVLSLTSRPQRLLASILIANELTNIAFAALVAALVESTFTGLGEAEATLIATAVALPALLVFGEITPKTIALKAAEVWARVAARPVALIDLLLTPLRVVLRGFIGLALALVGQRPRGPDDAQLRESEFRTLVDAGSEEGALEARERQLIHNVFDFGDRTVAPIMTPAARMFALPADLPAERMLEEVQRSRYSRIPVYRGSRDNVVGILLAKELVGLARGRALDRPLERALLRPYFVPGSARCDFVFRQMQRRKTHMAVVVDERGRTVGLVTMEDLLEELFGEITDEKEAPRPEGSP